MLLHPRLRLRAALAIAVLVAVAACSSTAAPSATAPTSTPAATDAPGAREAFAEAVCPVFTALVALDPRLAALRAAGGGGGDVSDQAQEIAAVGDEIGRLLDDLEAAPQWSTGAPLRLELITALHAIRAHLLSAGEDASAEDLASIPFIASAAMDRSMSEAAAAGLACRPAS